MNKEIFIYKIVILLPSALQMRNCYSKSYECKAVCTEERNYVNTAVLQGHNFIPVMGEFSFLSMSPLCKNGHSTKC